jgi:hypothetical protein
MIASAVSRAVALAMARLANWSATTSQKTVWSGSFGSRAAPGSVSHRNSTSRSPSKGNRATAATALRRSAAKSPE